MVSWCEDMCLSILISHVAGHSAAALVEISEAAVVTVGPRRLVEIVVRSHFGCIGCIQLAIEFC
jgi:hypothetical protein